VETDLKRRYERALHVCTINLKNESGLDHHKSALCFFRLGVVLSRLKELESSIKCFSDAFLLRDLSFEKVKESQFREFHEVQMARYILGKRGKAISNLAEGDMVHDLIKHRYTLLLKELSESQIPFTATNMRAFYESVKIDFPWEMDDIDSLGVTQY